MMYKFHIWAHLFNRQFRGSFQRTFLSATWVSSPQKGLLRVCNVECGKSLTQTLEIFQGEALQKSRSVLLFIYSERARVHVYFYPCCMRASEKWRRSRNSFESSRRSFILLFDGTIKRRGGFFQQLCLRAAFHDLHIKIEYVRVCSKKWYANKRRDCCSDGITFCSPVWPANIKTRGEIITIKGDRAQII